MGGFQIHQWPSMYPRTSIVLTLVIISIIGSVSVWEDHILVTLLIGGLCIMPNFGGSSIFNSLILHMFAICFNM